MIEPHDAPRRAEAVRQCVAANDLDAAVRLMLDFVRQFSSAAHVDEVVLFSRDLRELDDMQRREEVTALEARKERRRVVQNLLHLLRLVLGALERELALG